MYGCDCNKWDEGIKAVNGPITLQSARSGGNYQFDQNYVFEYCPWCGKELRWNIRTKEQAYGEDFKEHPVAKINRECDENIIRECLGDE